jgi:ABC-type phosphate transport system substrate-binding protein
MMAKENTPNQTPVRRQTPDSSRPAPRPKPALPEEKQSRSAFKFSTAFLIFLGSLLGSLIGAAADFGGALDTFERFQSRFYPELCIVGSNTVLGDGINMASDWAAAFEETHEVNVSIDGIGSVNGVNRAVEGGCVHILTMSEPMLQTQFDALTNAGIEIDCAAEIGYDVIAFVTDVNNRIPALLERNLSTILKGGIRNWDDVGGGNQNIYILARPGSGTTEYVLINIADYTQTGSFPPDAYYIPCNSNNECLDMTLSTPGSLYWVSTAWMRTQPPEYLRVLPVLRGDEAPTNPLLEDVDLNEYPSGLIRPLYFYVLGGSNVSPETSQLAREFLNYTRSVAGQQILEQYHFYNHFSRPARVQVTLPPGFETTGSGPRAVCKQV